VFEVAAPASGAADLIAVSWGSPVNKRRKIVVVGGALALIVAVFAYYLLRARSVTLVLTGIVTTNDVIVSPLVAGQVGRLLVNEGDAVQRGQLLAVIQPDELRAESAYYGHSAEGAAAQVQEGQAALRYQERESGDQIRQAEASLAATQAQHVEAAAALENARLVFGRTQQLARDGVASAQDLDQARTAHEAAQARLLALQKQVEAQRAAVSLARASAEQTAMRRDQLQASRRQLEAANAQRTKAEVRLAYTELRAPIDALVDVRAVRQGEVVGAGQPVLTLINPDDLWVRADVEETYIDRVRLGDRLTVRLPSGAQLPGTVFFRGVDAGFATQRDVSRTKRDVKTFEVRLRVDNRERRLAVGMTAQVLLPVPR
jgi:HlyD family secretion protein